MNLEDLKIYKQYLEFIYYIEMITEKYPKVEKNSLVSTIKNTSYEGIKLIIRAQKEYDFKTRLKLLNEIDDNLKMLKVLSRISHRKKYISGKNYMAWSKKINNIGILLGGWINSCVKR